MAFQLQLPRLITFQRVPLQLDIDLPVSGLQKVLRRAVAAARRLELFQSGQRALDQLAAPKRRQLGRISASATFPSLTV
jgi:hypothetical protein